MKECYYYDLICKEVVCPNRDEIENDCNECNSYNCDACFWLAWCKCESYF